MEHENCFHKCNSKDNSRYIVQIEKMECMVPWTCELYAFFSTRIKMVIFEERFSVKRKKQKKKNILCKLMEIFGEACLFRLCNALVKKKNSTRTFHAIKFCIRIFPSFVCIFTLKRFFVEAILLFVLFLCSFRFMHIMHKSGHL